MYLNQAACPDVIGTTKAKKAVSTLDAIQNKMLEASKYNENKAVWDRLYQLENEFRTAIFELCNQIDELKKSARPAKSTKAKKK